MEIKLLFSDDAKAVYEYVSKRSLSCKSERIMYNAIMRNLELIRKNPQVGNNIAKNLIPKEYIKKYNLQNLYRIELPMFWRMLYTLKDNKIEIIAFVLDIIDHKEYNKKFKYKA
jgi:hypothetical protein